ncbi:hypothetical protein GWC95_06855 [Sediminibacterium roseum]|uniref:Uncharacterized protein n=1 Tax=Sediminibacterium roseum TaxID=1978412 RepID=A0ABW9ZUB3_9BACT|nr:hypothetical protein [Sediminibacterium roseum]NCI49633.1 hypothetical protein [Sediminibacterium roseum]
MKKHLLVVLICIIAASTLFAAATPKADASSKTTVKPAMVKSKEKNAVKTEAKKFRYECRSFPYTAVCETMPMDATICGNNLPPEDDENDVWWHMMLSVMYEIDDILCPGYWSIP